MKGWMIGAFVVGSFVLGFMLGVEVNMDDAKALIQQEQKVSVTRCQHEIDMALLKQQHKIEMATFNLKYKVDVAAEKGKRAGWLECLEHVNTTLSRLVEVQCVD